MAAVAVVVAACGGGAPPAGGPMRVTGAFVPEPAGNVAAAYFTLANGTGRDDTLVAVSSPAADVTVLHVTEIVDGVARMTERDGVPVPAGGSVTLAPGGTHVMLLGVDPVVEGQTIELTLRFDHAPPLTIEAPVTALGSVEPPR